MTARFHRATAVQLDAPSNLDLARLDDDGGARRQSTVETRPRLRDDRLSTPMIPGAREPGMLTTFGVPALVIPQSASTMDAATIAARQREGGGAPNQRRPARVGSPWTRLRQTLMRVLLGHERS
jgi:hypothetical protein